MAENKKSFIIYTSWKIWLDGLTNEQKGMWLNWMMDYCNDLNPDYPKDQAVKIACMMAQDTLKRDLKKYEFKVESIKRAREQREKNNNQTEISMKSECNQYEISSVNVNDNVNVNVNVLDKSNNKENTIIKEKTPKSRFSRPSVDEIKIYCDEYCQEKHGVNSLIDAQDFFDFYESKGWVVGKSPMKDWKAAVRTWINKRVADDPRIIQKAKDEAWIKENNGGWKFL